MGRAFPRTIAMAGLTLLVACSDPSGERELRSGLRELKRENYERAFVLFQRSIEKRPGHLENAAANNYLGMAARGLNRFDEARAAFEDSQRLNPNLAEPVYNLGVLAAGRGDYREAVRQLNQAASMKPEDARPLEYLAGIYLKRSQWELARAPLYFALDREPRSARIYNSIGVAHAGMQQPDQALEAFMYALEADTKYAPTLLNLAIVYDTTIGDAGQARAYYKQFLDVAPRNERAAAVRAAIDRLDARGAMAAAKGSSSRPADITAPALPAQSTHRVPVTNLPAAVTSRPAEIVASPVTNAGTTRPVDQALASATTTVAASPYETLMKQAGDRARAGQMQQAIDHYVRAAEAADGERRVELQERAYREAARVAVDQPRAHVLLGQHLYDRGRYDQAARSFRTAATINADYAPAQLGLARLAVRNNEADAAVVHYRRAMTSDPAMVDAAWEFAQLYDKQLELPENAARAYRDFAAKFPGDRRHATALQRAEELMPTIRPAAVTSATPARSAPPAIDYRAPARRNPDIALQAFRRGFGYQEKQDWERAIFFYLRSLENDDQTPRTFYNLGICYGRTGERDLARDAYRRAIRLQPDFLDAKYNLALLHRDAGELPPAIDLLKEIIQTDDTYAYAHYLLGTIYGGSTRTRAEARRHYERFLQLAPDDRSAPALRQWLSNN